MTSNSKTRKKKEDGYGILCGGIKPIEDPFLKQASKKDGKKPEKKQTGKQPKK